MARGSIVKRCSICRQKAGRTLEHVCTGQLSYYVVYLANGKQKWELGGSTKKEAERLLAQRLGELNNGSYRESRKIIFEAFANTWLENCPKSRVKESTYSSYKSDIKCHLAPAFKNHLINRIDPVEIQEFLSKLRERLDPKTVNNIRLTLYMILDYARRLKYIIENPVADIRPYKIEHKEMDFLNPEEINLLLKHAREPFRTLLLTAILTGMRKSELLALQWGDIDWNSQTVFVRRSVYWSIGGKWVFVSPKSKRSVRAIVMPPSLRKALEIHRIEAPINPHDLVFANREGNPIDAHNLSNREFLPLLRMAGLRRIRWHDLRHSYCSLLIAQGENIKFIQSQLGHASIQTTIDRYGHLLPVNHGAVGERMDQHLFGSLSNGCLMKQAEMPETITYQEQTSLAPLDATR